MEQSLLNAENCPNLILGAPSGVSAQEAVAAFARASRRIKADSNAPFSIEDLTTALSEVESSNRSKESELTYSIPANISIYQKDAIFVFDGTTVTSDAELSEIDVSQIETIQKPLAAQVFLAAAIKQILLWNWDKASNFARTCLRLSTIEDERDEALNILAASLAVQGDASKALDALKKAVEGEWNLALQTNLAIIATKEDPALAVEHMSHLVAGAVTVLEQIRACRTAIHIWRSSQSEETGSDDDDDFEPLPRVFLNSIQSLIKNPDISEETFYEFGKFLARVDTESFGNSGSLEVSRYGSSPTGQAIKLRLLGPGEFIGGIVEIASNADVAAYPWIHDEVDQLVRSINSELLEDEPEKLYPAMAFSFLSDGLDCSNRWRIIMRALLVGKLHKLLEDDALPSEVFIKWIEEAQTAVRTNSAILDDDDKEMLTELLANSGNYLAQRFYYIYLGQGQKIESTANSILNMMSTFSGRRRANRSDIGETSGIIINWCSEAATTLNSALKVAVDDEIRQTINRMIGTIQTIKRKQLNL